MNLINQAGKTQSIPKGLALSSFISIFITLVVSLLIADSLNKERITWEQAGYWIMGMLFTASFVGGKSAYFVIRRQRFTISIMSGIMYWGILLCITALFWGGNFEAVWETAVLIGSGCCTSAVLYLPNVNKHKQKAGRGIVKLNKKALLGK